MVDFEKMCERPQQVAQVRAGLVAKTFKLVYGWMALGLAVSGAVAWLTATFAAENPEFLKTLLKGPVFYGLIIAELALVITLSAAINKLPVYAALLMFFGYAALNGVTLSFVFFAFKLATLMQVFFVTAGMFGGLALWGTFTREDLSSVGSFCGMALWGLVLASVVNLFVGSSALGWVCSIVGVLVFTGLTMYDAQKIRQIAAREGEMDRASLGRASILGALSLYLDFVNLFLYLLRLMGRER